MKRAEPTARPQGPQHYWAQMVALSRKGGFTITDIYKASSQRARSTVKDYVRFCFAEGHLLQVGEQPTVKNRQATLYKVRDPRLAAPIQRRADFEDDRGRRAQQLWTAMRALRVFTAQELAIAASTDAVPVPESTARGFLRLLAKAGYVAEVGTRTSRGQRAHWKLLPAFNTGPLAPARIESGTVLYDRNNGRSINLNAPETVGRAA